MSDATLDDYKRWTRNAEGTLGLRGEVYPDDCPRGLKKCDDCKAFMGHKAEMPAYCGQGVGFCCADRLA